MIPPYAAKAATTLTNCPPPSKVHIIELYLDSPYALEKAHERYGDSQGLLRRAAQSVADAGRGDDGTGSRESGDNEVRALSDVDREVFSKFFT